MKAKEFIDKKQDEHFKQFGVYADTNFKIAKWLEEYAKIVLNIAAEKAKLENIYPKYDINEDHEIIHFIVNKESIINCLKN